MGKRRQAAGAQANGRPESAAGPADNNFDALRLVFAALVFAYHLALLPGLEAWAPTAEALATGAELGVQGFFVLSGYLVYGSLKRSGSVWTYAEKRVRRLYPAYAVVVLACGLAAVALVPEARANLAGVGAYLGWNLVFLNFMAPDLPGVFEANPMSAVNGALWTIKIEVMFYACLPVLAWLLARGPVWRWGLIVGIYVLAEVWRLGFIALSETSGRPGLVSVALQLPGQMGFFLVGVAAHHLPPAWLRRPDLLAAAAAVLAGSILTDWLEPLRALSLGWVSLALAAGWRRGVDAARFGDLSYGVYIVHFPVIQALVAAGAFVAAPLLAAAAAVGLVLLASILMWWGVERPALRTDSAYRRA